MPAPVPTAKARLPLTLSLLYGRIISNIRHHHPYLTLMYGVFIVYPRIVRTLVHIKYGLVIVYNILYLFIYIRLKLHSAFALVVAYLWRTTKKRDTEFDADFFI